MSHLSLSTCDRRVVVGDRRSGRPWLGSSRVCFAWSLDSSLQSPGQEKRFGILFSPLRVVVCETHKPVAVEICLVRP